MVRASHIVLQASAAQTATGNSSAVEVGEYTEALVTLNCTAASGTTPTMTVKVQTSDDKGTTWYDLPSGGFTQLTAAGKQALQITCFGDYIRALWTIGGSTPSFTFVMNVTGKG